MANNDNTNLRACVHGSLWCGTCRHNIFQFPKHDPNAGHMTLMGRPKYGPRAVRVKVTKKGKQAMAQLAGGKS